MTVEHYEIAPGVNSTEFTSYILQPNDGVSADWPKAISVFRTRFESRFFNPLQNFRGSPSNREEIHGFVVLSCAFMLIETLGGFLQGLGDHTGESKNLFVAGLDGIHIESTTGAQGVASLDQKRALYSQGRCALLHTAGTEMIRVKTTGPALLAVSSGGFEINRDAFLDWVKGRFEDYAIRLAQPNETNLRNNFIKKMNFISAN